jgi:hypothetical protein
MADVPGSIAALRVPIARATPPVAVIYGIGIYWIVWSLAVGLLSAVSLFVRLPISGLYLPAAVLLGSAAAISVTVRSGGWLAAVALALLGLFYGLALACQSNAGTGRPSCDLGPFFSAHVGELVGAVVGLPLAVVLQKRGGRSTVLLAAAIIAIAIPLLLVLFVPLGPVTGSDAYERYLWTIRLEAAAAFAAGAVLAAMARRAELGLLVLGAALLLPWLGGLRAWWEDWQFLQARGITLNFNAIVQIEWRSFLPLIYFALVLLGFATERAFGAMRRNIGEQRLRSSDGGVPPDTLEDHRPVTSG